MDIQTVVYEVDPTGFSLARAYEREGVTAIVAAPSRIIRAVKPMANTDSLDCRKLAVLAAKDMIKPIAVPSEWEEELENARSADGISWPMTRDVVTRGYGVFCFSTALVSQKD